MNFTLKMLDGNTCPTDSPLYGKTVEFQQDDEPVWFEGPVAVDDPEWEYTDSQGHDHYRVGNEFPTLRSYVETCPGCSSCYDNGMAYTWKVYECIGCGETVTSPGMRREYGASSVRTGLRTVYIDDEYVPYTDFLEIVDEHNRVVEYWAQKKGSKE